MTIHKLKILPEYFRKVKNGLKKAEIRFDDRDFMPGDRLLLQEWKPRKKEYTGREIDTVITDITRLCYVIPEVDHRWCVLHMELL